MCYQVSAGILSLDAFEVITIIISIIALIISIASIHQNNKHTHLNLQSRYFEKIFDEYLIKKYPSQDNTFNILIVGLLMLID